VVRSSARGTAESGDPGARGVHVPRVVVGRRRHGRLPGHAAAVSRLHVQVRVVLRHGAGVGAAVLGLTAPVDVHAVRVGGVDLLRWWAAGPLVALQEALQRHRVALGQEERGARQVVARDERLPRALQVEQDAGAVRRVHVPVVLQEPVVEEAAVPVADGLYTQAHALNTSKD